MNQRSAIKTDLFAAELRKEKIDRLGDPLVDMEKYIDFAALGAEVDRVAPRPGRAQGGRPPFPTEVMVRILVLKRLYNLSDEQMEYQLLDRMSYQRFCKLTDSASIPDRTTIWTFENRIGEAGAQAIFEGVEKQLLKAGYIARGGQIVDATLIPVPKQRLTSREKETLEQGTVPEDWSEAKRRQKDVDATWTKKHGKSTFGYKLSIDVDVKGGRFVRKHTTSTASTHDSQHFDALLDPANTSKDIYADSAYASQPREESLKAEGFRPQIQHKGQRNKPLSARGKRRNRRISRTRALVEHVFARLTQMGGKMIRTIGIKRARFATTMMVACYNITRLVFLEKQAKCAC